MYYIGDWIGHWYSAWLVTAEVASLILERGSFIQ